MRILIISAFALTSLIGGYSYWWNFVADQAVIGIEQWKNAQAAKGLIVTHDPLNVEGFPYRVHISTASLKLQQISADGANTQTVEVPSIWAIAQPWNLKHVILGSSGTISYQKTTKTSEISKTQDSFTITPEKAIASLTVSTSGELQALAIDLSEPVLAGNLFGSGKAMRLQIHSRAEERDLNKEGTDAAQSHLTLSRFQQVAFRADGLTLDRLQENPLGPTIEKLNILLESASNFNDFKDRSAIEKWRDAGGVIDVTNAELSWGPSHLSATGSLTLDQDNYPLGAFNTKVKGFAELFTEIAKSRQMNDKNIQTAVFALNMLSKSEKDGTRYVELPFSLQDQAAHIGPLKLFRLQPVF